MDDLLLEFLLETDDLLEILQVDLQMLRIRRDQGNARRDLIGRLFRHIHTIKGSASALDLDVTVTLAHEMESLLDEARMGRVAPDDAMIEALEDGAGGIATSIKCVRRGDTPQLPVMLIDRIRRIAAREGGEPPASGPDGIIALLPEDVGRSLSPYERVKLSESIGEGARLFIINVNFALETFDERFRELSAELSANGDLISTMPGVDPAALDQISFRLVYSGKTSAEELSRRLEQYAALTINELSPAEPVIADEPPPAESPFDEPAPVSVVRVDLNELDDLVAHAHELATDTALALDAALGANLPRAELHDLELRAARIRRRFNGLEERLIELRMVALDQTLSRAIRTGALAARSSGKEVEFSKFGGDVQIDKSLADGIYEPLLHLVRNAVDHGIEKPEARQAAGKLPRGSIRLEAESAGSQVRIRITDDGRGLDLDTIRQVAIDRGLGATLPSLSEQQLQRLIFQPGFSTAKAVSDLSGRGVGLDVVETMVARVGGEIHFSSSAETGTTFELTLPTTLALVPTLVVNSAGSQYCLPANYIAEVGYLDRERIQVHEGGGDLTWRDRILPFTELRQLLGQAAIRPSERQHLVIARLSQSGNQTQDGEPEELIALGVDSWEGHREILVRSLGRRSDHWWGISGAAELPNGRVALVLDLPRLLGIQLPVASNGI
jgi:two-component system chemotaxis sensor kinase CheA